MILRCSTAEQREPSIAANFIYVFGSQLLNLIVGFAKALVIPLMCSIVDYAYWQIYVFYAVYVGMFTLGYNDGIYLRYGGTTMAALARPEFKTANSLYLLWIVLSGAVLGFVATWTSDISRLFVFTAIGLNVIILGVIGNVFLTLQASGLLKLYAALNSIDKAVFLIGLLALAALHKANLHTLIYLDVLSKFVVLAIVLSRFGDLFIGNMRAVRAAAVELVRSVTAGLNLLVANLAGMLVLGVGRIVIEIYGEVANYAQYAFAISLSNIVLTSVTALSIVIYPSLRRQAEDRYFKSFKTASGIYTLFVFLMLCGYFLANVFIRAFAHEFRPVLDILNVMFVITALQGRMQLINNTYYKVLRLERAMLVANLTAVAAVLPSSLLGYWMLQSVGAIAYATLATMVCLVYGSELYLRMRMGGRPSLAMLGEGVMLVTFLSLTSISSLVAQCMLWLAVGLVLAYLKRSDLTLVSDHFRSVFR